MLRDGARLSGTPVSRLKNDEMAILAAQDWFVAASTRGPLEIMKSMVGKICGSVVVIKTKLTVTSTVTASFGGDIGPQCYIFPVANLGRNQCSELLRCSADGRGALKLEFGDDVRFPQRAV